MEQQVIGIVEASGPLAREWSAYQRAVFEDFATGTGHTVVEAVAGSGKSTTLVEGIRHAPPNKKVLFCAFNSSTAKELAERVPAGTVAKTTHSIGYGTVCYAWRSLFPKIELDDKREFKMSKELVPRWSDDDRGALLRLVAMAKAWVLTDEAKLTSMAAHYDIRPAAVSLPELVQRAQQILFACLEPSATISYDDMIYIPVALGLRPKTYDMVVIDECQDLARGQIELCLASLRRGGRIIAVGDSAQCIYGFRGADTQALARLTKRLGAKTLPLSVTYRCPRSVVARAQKWVPHIEAAPHAQDGTVDGVTVNDMLAGWAPGDFVLSRVNAPLVTLCVKAWRQNVPAVVLGRDVGEAVRTLVDRYSGDSITGLIAYVRDWEDREVSRLKAAKKDDKIDGVLDRADTVIALCEDVVDLAALRRRINTIFAENKTVDRAATLVFASTHKAKGLEAKTVWMLERTYRAAMGGEEANLAYVACTRALETLHLVQWDPKNESLR